MNIIFIHPENIGRTTSGSGVRPIEMRKAFKQKAKHFFEITGPGRQKFISFLAILNFISQGNKIDFVYFENLSRPHVLNYKVLFGRRFPIPSLSYFCFLIVLKLLGIPVFYFFRDAHWNHRDLYPSHFSKKAFYTLKIFGNLEVLMLKASKFLVCYPNEKFCQYMMDNFGLYGFALPPKGSKQFEKYVKKPKINLFYVGGCTGMYHPRILFDSIRYLEEKYNIVFCTRKKDWHTIEETLDVPNNVKIIHANGKELNQWFKWADIGLCLMPPSKYVNMAFSVKVGEYISAGLPVLGIKDTYVGDYVSSMQIGWSVKADPEELTKFLRNLSLEDINHANKNISRKIEHFNWSHNCDSIIQSIASKEIINNHGLFHRIVYLSLYCAKYIIYKLCKPLTFHAKTHRYFLRLYKNFSFLFSKEQKTDLLNELRQNHYHTYIDTLLACEKSYMDADIIDLFELKSLHHCVDPKRLESQMRRLAWAQFSRNNKKFSHTPLLKLIERLEEEGNSWPSFIENSIRISRIEGNSVNQLKYEQKLKALNSFDYVNIKLNLLNAKTVVDPRDIEDILNHLDTVCAKDYLRRKFIEQIELMDLLRIFIDVVNKGRFSQLKFILESETFPSTIFNQKFFEDPFVIKHAEFAKELIELSEQAIYSSLAVVKSSTESLSQIWYSVFKDIIQAQDASLKVRRRYASYLIHFKKETSQHLSDSELDFINNLHKTGNLDNNDAILFGKSCRKANCPKTSTTNIKPGEIFN